MGVVAVAGRWCGSQGSGSGSLEGNSTGDLNVQLGLTHRELFAFSPDNGHVLGGTLAVSFSVDGGLNSASIALDLLALGGEVLGLPVVGILCGEWGAVLVHGLELCLGDVVLRLNTGSFVLESDFAFLVDVDGHIDSLFAGGGDGAQIGRAHV